MLRDLLVHVTGSQASRRRIDYAIALADAVGSRLIGFHVLTTPDVPRAVRPVQVEEAARELAEHEQDAAAQAEAQFRAAIAGSAIETRWMTLAGGMAARACQSARYADLVIVGHEPTEVAAERNPMSLADELLLKSGRPVLVLADAEDHPPPPKRVLIAWDGSRAAVRAIHDALPLLARAQATLLLIANPDQEHIDEDVVRGDELIDHLARHGVTTSAAETLRLHRPEPEVILGYLENQDVDLLVMGGFGHLAWREVVFGGTTPELMRKTRVPIFLSH